MDQPVTFPFWLLLVLGLLSAVSVYRYGLLPAWRWYWSRWSRRIAAEVNPHLQLRLSPFTLTGRRGLVERLMGDPAVQAAMDDEIAATGAARYAVQRRVRKIAHSMVPAFSPFFYFRLGYFMARSALRSLYRVRIGFVDEAALTGVSDDTCVVFFMNHRSNIDYVLISYLTSRRTMLSFGVGEWAHIWPIQPLMRAADGYFLRRDSGDKMYRKILERYVQMATEGRVPHAMFPEGALSPDGGLQDPKMGLLSYMTKNFDPATSPDIVFIPIGTNYDRVPEDINMIGHDPAEFRQKGRTFVYRSGASIGSRVFWQMLRRDRSFGYACANFGTPVTFKDWLYRHWVEWPQLNRDGRFQWLNRLGGELMDDIEMLIPVVPMALFCRALLASAENGTLARATLRHRFHEEVMTARNHGGHVFLPRDSEDEGFQTALTLAEARHVVRAGPDDSLIVEPDNLDLARYYANSISQYYRPA